jgi:HEAT repeat protein
MTEALCNDSDWFVRWIAIRVLGAVKTRDAIAGLVEGLGCDYSGLRRGKVSADHDYNREYRDEIATTLKEITGSDFGTDKKKWTDWLHRGRSTPSINN